MAAEPVPYVPAALRCACQGSESGGHWDALNRSATAWRWSCALASTAWRSAAEPDCGYAVASDGADRHAAFASAALLARLVDLVVYRRAAAVGRGAAASRLVRRCRFARRGPAGSTAAKVLMGRMPALGLQWNGLGLRFCVRIIGRERRKAQNDEQYVHNNDRNHNAGNDPPDAARSPVFDRELLIDAGELFRDRRLLRSAFKSCAEQLAHGYLEHLRNADQHFRVRHGQPRFP